jgi:hypothetical protein
MKSPVLRSLAFGLTIAVIALTAFAQGGPTSRPQPGRGLVRNLHAAFQGYTVVAPLRSTSTYLVDMEGEVVHEWESEYTPTFGVHLLANGDLLRAGYDSNNPHFKVGGRGGIVQEISWDGKVVWQFVYSNRLHAQHHDIEPLPNGNVLLLAWERKTAHEALMAGRDPKLLTGPGLWPEHLVEIRPLRPKGGEIVWEWHLWDHLIQDRDPRLRNFGKLEEHPELVNINGDVVHRSESDEELSRLRALGYIVDSPQANDRRSDEANRNSDWNHANSISYNPGLNQIALSVLRFSEIWIIDHSTTTEEAAGHSGGTGGRGGDLLYRWGNPQTYRGARLAEQPRLFNQHDVRWIPDGWPGAGNLTVFNNGRGRPDGEYSSVDEIRLPVNGDGRYESKDGASFAAAERVWSFAGSSIARFFSGHVSGAERLPNGNTLVCVGEHGRIFEVTPKSEIVWDYLNPIAGEVSRELPPWLPPSAVGAPMEVNPYGLLRASRIPSNHPGLARLTTTGEN